jgi:hypothetical protein
MKKRDILLFFRADEFRAEDPHSSQIIKSGTKIRAFVLFHYLIFSESISPFPH